MRSSTVLLFIAYLGFISLGLPDATHGINWPFVKDAFAVPTGWLGLVIAAGGIGYLLSSFSVGVLLKRLGVGWLLTNSSLLVGIGLIGFLVSGSWWFFLVCAVVIGIGSGAIDAGLNAYAAENFSTQQMNWLHAAFGVGATGGPIIVTAVLVYFDQWRWGYGVIGVILLFMSLVFFFSRHLWHSDPTQSPVSQDTVVMVSQRQALAHPVVRLQIVFFLFYTGVEVGVGQWAFTVLTQQRDITIATAGSWVAMFWAGLAIGRAIFGFVVARVSVDKLLWLCLLGMLLGSLVLSIDKGSVFSLVGLIMIGFCAAPIFPCMISRTVDRVGKAYARHAIGFQMSAAVMGAMTLPFLSGVIGEMFGFTALTLTFGIFAFFMLLLFFYITRKPITKT